MTNSIVPIMKAKLPTIDDAMPYLKRIDQNQIYSNNGPLVQELESRIAQMMGLHSASEVVVASSATLLLEGLVSISKVRGFYSPSYTFPATNLAILRGGKKLFLTDINSENFEILVPSNKPMDVGVMCVLPFGSNFSLRKQFSNRYVIVDAAASIGNFDVDWTTIQREVDFVFSLHATKVMGCGEGGFAIVRNQETMGLLRSWINFGFHGSRSSQILSTNAKMSEFSAAYALASHDGLEQEIHEWETARSLADKYVEKSNTINRLITHGVSPYLIVEFVNADVAKTFKKNSEKSISWRHWWDYGCHQMNAFGSLDQSKFPNTERLAPLHVGLPFFRGIDEGTMERIAETLAAD